MIMFLPFSDNILFYVIVSISCVICHYTGNIQLLKCTPLGLTFYLLFHSLMQYMLSCWFNLLTYKPFQTLSSKSGNTLLYILPLSIDIKDHYHRT